MIIQHEIIQTGSCLCFYNSFFTHTNSTIAISNITKKKNVTADWQEQKYSISWN